MLAASAQVGARLQQKPPALGLVMTHSSLLLHLLKTMLSQPPSSAGVGVAAHAHGGAHPSSGVVEAVVVVAVALLAVVKGVVAGSMIPWGQLPLLQLWVVAQAQARARAVVTVAVTMRAGEALDCGTMRKMSATTVVRAVRSMQRHLAASQP